MTNHTFATTLRWMGNLGSGTSSYRAYARDYELSGPLKTSPIAGSSAKTYRGDDTRYNPEELLVAALSSCHLLAYLHLCADAGIVGHDLRNPLAPSVTAVGLMRTLDDDGKSVSKERALVDRQAPHPHGEEPGSDAFERTVDRLEALRVPILGLQHNAYYYSQYYRREYAAYYQTAS